MNIKIGTALLTSLVFLICPILEAQQPTTQTILRDAGYVFNRYEELATGIDCNSWKVRDSLKETCKGELKAIESNVQSVKTALDRSVGSKNPSLIDLFDVFVELQEVGGHLDDPSSNITDFTDRNGEEYARAGSKALILAAQLGREIRNQLIAQQVSLEQCGR